jgi:hypothetical protein
MCEQFVAVRLDKCFESPVIACPGKIKLFGLDFTNNIDYISPAIAGLPINGRI